MSCDDDKDVCESALWHFFSALSRLVKSAENSPPESHFETPWEMRQDFLIGLEAIRKDKSIELTNQQSCSLEALEKSLCELPVDAISGKHLGHGGEVTWLLALNHPGWSTIREQAKEVITYLEPLISRNRSFFDAHSRGC